MKQQLKQRDSLAFSQQKRLYSVLPILVVPFLTLIFWILDGGKATAENFKEQPSGFNMELPSASLPADSSLNKMAFYELARKDSLQRAEQLRNDPYFQTAQHAQPEENGYPADDNERRIQEKLSQLNVALTSQANNSQASYASGQTYQRDNSTSKAELDRLESMMGQMQAGDSGDPEMQQIGSMLGQILDIQHPDRVQQRIKAASAKSRGSVMIVSTNKKSSKISMLDDQPKGKIAPMTGFYTLEEPEKEQEEQNAIQAVIYDTQTLTSGSIVKLRLLDEVYVSGHLVPKNTFLFATATISGERLMLTITNLRSANSLYPVNLKVYDLDGLDGLYIPGAIARDVGKNSADQALQTVTMGTNLDPSIGMQAMGAGIEAAKTLISKKVKLVKVTVKAGYFVLLKNANNEDNN